MTPAVSVVIATYNYGRFLAGAVESVLAQTFQDFEVIIVDDGSEDDTPEVARRLLRDARVRYQRTPRQGQPATKNTGIRLAKAPLVAFLDADDLWLPVKLERQVPLFARDRNVAVVYARKLVMDEQGNDLPYTQPELYRGDILALVFRRNFVHFSSVVARRDVLLEVGLFDESIPMGIDYDLWLRVALRYSFDYVDEPLVRYRTGHANLSQRQDERIDIAIKVMHRFLDERGGRARLSKHVIRRAWAETYCTAALVRSYRSRLAALPWFAKSLIKGPLRWKTWRELLSLAIPNGLRRRLRRMLGRPAWADPRQVSGTKLAQ
jgi:glycosyltransferase involved in cell wall biosynthesis